MSGTSDWKSFDFSDTAFRLSLDSGYCLTIQRDKALPGSDNASTIYLAGVGGSGLLRTADGGANWSYSSGHSLYYRVYGSFNVTAEDEVFTNFYVSGLNLNLLIGSDTRARIGTQALLWNSPELMSHFWEIDFTEDPTQTDSDFDQQQDWKLQSKNTFDLSELVGGIWNATTLSDPLRSATENNFDQQTTIFFSARNTSLGNGKGAVFRMDFDANNTKQGRIETCLQLEPDDTQTFVLTTFSADKTAVERERIPGLSSAFIDLRITTSPDNDRFAVWINGHWIGTYDYPSFPPESDPCLSLFADGSNAEFNYASVRIGNGPYDPNILQSRNPSARHHRRTKRFPSPRTSQRD